MYTYWGTSTSIYHAFHFSSYARQTCWMLSKSCVVVIFFFHSCFLPLHKIKKKKKGKRNPWSEGTSPLYACPHAGSVFWTGRSQCGVGVPKLLLCSSTALELYLVYAIVRNGGRTNYGFLENACPTSSGGLKEVPFQGLLESWGGRENNSKVLTEVSCAATSISLCFEINKLYLRLCPQLYIYWLFSPFPLGVNGVLLLKGALLPFIFLSTPPPPLFLMLWYFCFLCLLWVYRRQSKFWSRLPTSLLSGILGIGGMLTLGICLLSLISSAYI